MGKFLSLYSDFADWKRRWVTIASLTCLVGIVWEVNDLLQENQQHPWISPESELTAMQFDEFGDPYAIAKPKSLPYSKLWGNPLSQLSFAFGLTLIIGSLIRCLTRGTIALVVLLVFIAIIFGQGSLLNMQLGSSGSSVMNFLSGLDQHSGVIRSFIASYWQTIGVAAVGLYFGIFR